MERKPKYVNFVEWVDSLPLNKEFNFAEAEKAVDISRQSMSMIVLQLCKKGLLSQRIVNTVVKFYCKKNSWSKDKAIEANHQRLKAKWQRYKLKN